MNHLLPKLSDETIANLFSNHARQIFDLPSKTIKEGETVELTLFNRQEITQVSKTNSKSKSANSPFWDKALLGKVIGTFAKGKLNLNKQA